MNEIDLFLLINFDYVKVRRHPALTLYTVADGNWNFCLFADKIRVEGVLTNNYYKYGELSKFWELLGKVRLLDVVEIYPACKWNYKLEKAWVQKFIKDIYAATFYFSRQSDASGHIVYSKYIFLLTLLNKN